MRYIIGGVLLLLLAAIARASVPTCAITGNVTKLAGYPAANAKVYFITGELQNPGGTVVPGGERVMVTTDAFGNLPTTGGCLPTGTQFCPPQSSYFFVQVGSGPTSRRLQAPLMTTVDLDQLIIENNDPVSVVTDVQSGNSNCTTVNPGTGVAGTSTITCGTSVLQPGAVGPVYNIALPPYSAVSSTMAPSCNGFALSPNITCTGTGDFQVGQNITLNHAGAAMTLSAPAATVTSSKWALPAVNSDTADGTGGSDATYLVGALDGLGGIQMAAGPPIVIHNSQSTLSFNAFNKVAFTPTPGGSGTVICGCVGTACPLALIAIVPQNQNFYYDMGGLTGIHFGTSTDSSTLCVPGAAFNDNLNTTIAAVTNGLPASLTATLQNSVNSQPLFHDNSVAVNAAIAAACAAGGEVYAPAGAYTLSQIVVTPNVGINCKGIQFVGAGDGVQAHGSIFEWWGPLGGVPFKAFCIADSKFMDFGIDDQNGNTPEYGLQSSNVGCIANNNTNLEFSGVSVGESGYALYVSDTVNNSPLTFHQFKVFNGGIANFAFNNGQSKNNTFWGPIEAKRLYGLYQIAGGEQAFYGRQGVGWIDEWLANTANVADFGGESEVPSRWVVTAGPTSNTGAIGFYNVQLTSAIANVPPDGIAFSDSFNSPLILIGDNFTGGGLPQPTWNIYANNVGHNGAPAVISLGNGYPGMTPFSGVNAGNTVVSRGDRGANNSGVQVVLPEIAGTQNYYFGTTTNAIPACSALYARSYYCVNDETPGGSDTTCAGASTLGTTYAPGGALKCQLQCNTAGTLWKVTGQACY